MNRARIIYSYLMALLLTPFAIVVLFPFIAVVVYIVIAIAIKAVLENKDDIWK